MSITIAEVLKVYGFTIGLVVCGTVSGAAVVGAGILWKKTRKYFEKAEVFPGD